MPLNRAWASTSTSAASSRHSDKAQRSSVQSRSEIDRPKKVSTARALPIFIDSDDEDDKSDDSASGGRVKEEPGRKTSNDRSAASGIKQNISVGSASGGSDDFEAKEALRVALSKLDTEIKSVEEQLRPLQNLHSTLQAERRALETQLASFSARAIPTNGSASSSKQLGTGQVDYQSSSFPWSSAIRSTLKSTFGLTSFRLCQEGVINAAVDSRDIVCVMPTGGGKSLTYQLPAITGNKGLTVVVSPLLALIWDQVRALKELGIECVMLTGATSTGEQNEIYKRIECTSGSKELKMIYLTPEKVSKSKRLMAALEKANAMGRLKRFVIDEAHCCSQLGHDFRPDYKKLSVLKTLFPRVPIQAVTATLSSKTMPDLLKILRMAPITDGRAANTSGTVFFSAPLFRPNLHYKVLTKPGNAKTAIEKMGKWINEHHPGKSGIIYCFSKKDAETVAESLREWSNGEIKTGVYHAGVDDWSKEKIHLDWRKGKVNCICATIAFGLGIDKGDVRYVIHHSMSKSLEGYYQETGRAGRDGQDSDCVLFYRSQDAARLSSMIYGDIDGTSKMQEMLRFAQDLKTCRKVAFAKYFSTSTQLSAAAWDNPDALAASGGKITTCGICDNCVRDPASITSKDVTLESWKILTILSEVVRSGGRVTLANLTGLVRGLGGGGFAIPAGGKRKRSEPEKANLNVEDLIGEKISMNSDDTETLLVHLTLAGYLENSYSATAHSVNVYIVPGPKAVRLSRLSRTTIEQGAAGFVVECTFPNPETKAKKPRKKAEKTIVDIEDVGIESDGSEQEATKACARKVPGSSNMSKATKKEPADNDEREDLRSLDGWDEPFDDEDEEDNVFGMAGIEEASDSDAGSSERENGWKVDVGSAGGKGVRRGDSKSKAIVLSD